MALDKYLALRPNLKTREDYRNSFITNSVLADTIIEAEVFTKNGAWIDKFVGDEAIGLFIPGSAGKDYPYLAIKSAIELLEATGHASSEGPWVFP